MFVPNRFRFNPFDKHIYKINLIIKIIENRQTMGGLKIKTIITAQDENCIKMALHYLSSAKNELEKMSRKKDLLR